MELVQWKQARLMGKLSLIHWLLLKYSINTIHDQVITKRKEKLGSTN